MLISEVIEALEEAKKKHGNVDVIVNISDDYIGYTDKVTGVSLDDVNNDNKKSVSIEHG